MKLKRTKSTKIKKNFLLQTSENLTLKFSAMDYYEAVKMVRKHYTDKVSVRLYEVISDSTKRLICDFDHREIIGSNYKPRYDRFTDPLVDEED